MGRVFGIAASAFLVLFVGLPLAAMLRQALGDGGGLGALRQLAADPTARTEFLASVQLGLGATAVAAVLGGGHAWLTWRTDLPLGKVLGPLGVAPLAMPPILVAMGFADLVPVQGFWACAALLGVCYAPFVAVLAGRGLRAVDGRGYEAALLARGRGAAERMLAVMVLPEVVAGCLFAFIFVVSEHGVPEFLTVKGKTWHTYAEGVFRLWTRRATGVTDEQLASPIVAAVPLVLLITVALVAALRLRARAGDRAAEPLPLRRLGACRWLALLLPATFLGAGVALPLFVMGRWAAGSTVVNQPPSLAVLRQSFRAAVDQAGGDLAYTALIASGAALLLMAVALPLARAAARGRGWLDHASVVPLAVPAILLAIGFVRVFNDPWLTAVYDHAFDFYDSPAIVIAAYGARFLPFGVLTLSTAIRRLPPSLEEAALLSGRRPLARSLRIHGPLLLPAMLAAACLIFVLALRELDVAVVLPAGNGTVVRRLSNVVHFGGENVGGALAILLLCLAVAIPGLGMVVSGRKLQSLS